jgi:hypothetical protein
MIEILALLTLLLIKHFVADFMLQTNTMVREKGHYGQRGGILHSAIHSIGTLVVFAAFGFGVTAIICAVIDFVAHYHIDWAKMNLSRDLTVQDARYWFYLGLDQLLHQLTYIGLVLFVVLK